MRWVRKLHGAMSPTAHTSPAPVNAMAVHAQRALVGLAQIVYKTIEDFSQSRSVFLDLIRCCPLRIQLKKETQSVRLDIARIDARQSTR